MAASNASVHGSGVGVGAVRLAPDWNEESDESPPMMRPMTTLWFTEKLPVGSKKVALVVNPLVLIVSVGPPVRFV